jgi:hypothetical protein
MRNIFRFFADIHRYKKSIAVSVFAVGVFFLLQLISTAVYYNCTVLKDDCPPPIFGPNAFLYRTIFHPFWLDEFALQPIEFSFADGVYTFWEGTVDGDAVVIRVPKNGSPVMQWIEMGLQLGTPIRQAQGNTILQWIAEHPEISLQTAV